MINKILEKKLTKYCEHYNCYAQGTHQEAKNYHHQIGNLRPFLEAIKHNRSG